MFNFELKSCIDIPTFLEQLNPDTLGIPPIENHYGAAGNRVCHIGTTGRLQYPADPAVPGYRQDPEPPRTARQRLSRRYIEEDAIDLAVMDAQQGDADRAPSSASADCGSLRRPVVERP